MGANPTLLSLPIAQEKFDENADLVAVAKRAGGQSFPDYFEVSRAMPEETEIIVYEKPVRDIPDPLMMHIGTVVVDVRSSRRHVRWVWL